MTKIMILELAFFFLFLPSFTRGFTHPELRDARRMQKPFWAKTHLAQIELINDTLWFGSLDLRTLLWPQNERHENVSDRNEIDNRCLEILRRNIDSYGDLVRRVAFENLTTLSDRNLDLMTTFGAWGSDVKYALWTLDHWNWVSNDMQCKMSQYWQNGNQAQKTQYCAYEIESGEDVRRNLVVGYCIPDSCTNREAIKIGKILSESVSRYWTEIIPNRTADAKMTMDCVPSYQPVVWYARPQAWLVIATMVISIGLIIMASIFQMRNNRNDGSKALKTICRIFSVQSNFRKLCHIPARAVGSTNGLKTLTMLFMMFCHVYLVHQAFDIDLDHSREAFRRHVLGPIMYNATYSVGTFFMVGAALQMWVTLIKFEESKNKRFSPALWLCAIVNRYSRLVPMLMFTTVLLAEVLSYLNFPLWTYIDTARRCPKDYWRHLLLVQNLQTANLCATWTWYLAVDFQLFLMNLPLVCLIQHRPKIGLSLLGALFVISCVIKAWLILHYDYPPNLMLMVPIPAYDENFSHYSFEIYMRPQGWWSAYLVGLALGYSLFKFGQKSKDGNHIDIAAKVYWPVSGLAATMILWAVFGIYFVANGFKNSIYDALYSGLVSAVWATGWAWVVFVCQFSLRAKWLNFVLSSRPMIFLSNLTYSCYLIHMPLVFGAMFTYATWMGGRPRLRLRTVEMLMIVFIMMVASWASALFLNLIIEGPAANLQSICMKAIFGKMRSDRRSKRDGNGQDNDVKEEKRLFECEAKVKTNGIEIETELEEYPSSSLMRPSEKYPTRRI